MTQTEHNQRKLTGFDLEYLQLVQKAIGKIDCRDWIMGEAAYSSLQKVLQHGTSDGLPWVEPAPEPFVPTRDYLCKYWLKFKRWPKVLTRRCETESWGVTEQELIYIKQWPDPHSDQAFVLRGGYSPVRFCQLAPGEPREVE